MKKLFSLIGVTSLISSASLSTSISNISVIIPTIDSNNNINTNSDNNINIDNVDISKYAAIAAIAPNYYNLNANDTLKYFKQIKQNSFTSSLSKIFKNSDDVNEMISANSKMKYSSAGDTINNHESNSWWNASTIFNLLVQTKLPLSSWINLSSSMDLIQILGKTFAPIFNIVMSTSSNVFERILQNLSLQDIYSTWIQVFGTYDSAGNNDLTKSHFYNMSYNNIFSSLSNNFNPNHFAYVFRHNWPMEESTAINVFTMFLLFVNFISQFNITNIESIHLFDKTLFNGDYRKSIMNLKFESLNTANLCNFLKIINNSNSNHGIGYEDLLAIFFTDSTNQNLDSNHPLIPTYYVTHKGAIEEPSKVYDMMPGTNFASTDSIAIIFNNIFKSIISEKYTSKQISINYLLPIHQSFSVKIFAKPLRIDCDLDIVQYILGPIIYHFLNQVANNEVISQTLDSLTVLLNLIKEQSANINIDRIQYDFNVITNNSNWYKKDNFKITTGKNPMVAYPIYLPPKVGLWYMCKTGLSNPQWDYDVANSAGKTFDTLWNGTDDNSLIHIFTKTINDIFEPLTNSPLVNVNSLPENLATVLNDKNSIIDILTNDNGLIHQWGKINHLIDTILPTSFDHDELVNDAYIFAKDINKQTNIYEYMTKKNPYDNSALGYAAALIVATYHHNANTGITNAQIMHDFWLILGYDTQTKTFRKGSFLATINDNWNIVTSLMENINSALLNLDSDLLSNFDNYYYDWSYHFVKQTGDNYEYVLTRYDAVFDVNLIKDANDAFYQMEISKI